MTIVVRAESLTKRYGDVLAVDDLSFALEAGTITNRLVAPAASGDHARVGDGPRPRRAHPERASRRELNDP